jgi:methionine-rich copper-binding protein CopC
MSVEYRCTSKADDDGVGDIGTVWTEDSEFVVDATMASFLPTVVPLCSVITLEYIKAHGYIELVTAAAPSVVSVYPEDEDDDVAVATPITITFSEPMDVASVVSAVTLDDNGEPTDITVTMDKTQTIATITPDDPLKNATLFIIKVSTAAEDVNGTAIGGAYAQANGFTTITA